MSEHLLHTFKRYAQKGGGVQRSLMSREYIHTFDSLRIYIQCFEACENQFERLLAMIGYWGQGNSFAYCSSVRRLEPEAGECVAQLNIVEPKGIKPYQLCYLADVDKHQSWEDVISGKAIQVFLYVLPLVLTDDCQHGFEASTTD